MGGYNVANGANQPVVSALQDARAISAASCDVGGGGAAWIGDVSMAARISASGILQNDEGFLEVISEMRLP